MTEWDKRAEAFEKAFEMDEALRFKVLARRNKRLGLWAAEQLGFHGGEAETYAQKLVADEVGRDDDKALVERLVRDLPAISAHRIGRRIEECAATARREIFAK